MFCLFDIIYCSWKEHHILERWMFAVTQPRWERSHTYFGYLMCVSEFRDNPKEPRGSDSYPDLDFGCLSTVTMVYWGGYVCVFVVQSCPALHDQDQVHGDLMDCSPPGSSVHEILQEEYWSEWPFFSPGNHPNPEIETGSPRLQADSLPSEPPELYFPH